MASRFSRFAVFLRPPPPTVLTRRWFSFGKPHPPVDAELRAHEAELRKAALSKAKAEARKADFEESAAKAKAEADAAKAKAEADAAKAKAEADAAKAKAEADAAKAKAEACKADLKADSAKAQAQADDAKAKADKSFFVLSAMRAIAGSVFLGVVWLVFDHVTHSFKPFVRWRMKCKLRAGPADDALPQDPDNAFPAMLPSFESGLPVILLGHTGSGKSTLLGRLARDYKHRGVPVAYVRLRGLNEGTGVGSGAGSESLVSSTQSDMKTIATSAAAVFSAIGYPSRPSYLSRMRLSMDNSALQVNLDSHAANETLHQFHEAVADLFSVCQELYGERSACSREDRPPIILIDELHDLVRNEQVKQLGGLIVFQHLAAEFTRSSTDAGTVRFCAAASSFALQSELNSTVASSFRVRPVVTHDPSELAVQERLLAKGFSASQVEQIMGVCGTRLRLLARFLCVDDVRKLDIAAELKMQMEGASVNIDALFNCVEGDAQARSALVSLMDRLCAGESGISIKALPRNLRKLPGSCNAVIYWASGNKIEIQSQPIRMAWKEMREQFVSSSDQ